MKNNLFIKFIILTLALILSSELLKLVLGFDKLLQNSLSEQLTATQIENYLQIQHKWKWVGFGFVPIYLFLKTIIISLIIYVGAFFHSKNEVKFKSIWNVIITCEFIFVIIPIFKIIWFYFFQTNYTFADLQYFYPLSALNIIGYKNIDAWFIYPLQILNVFEVAYWLLLAYYIGRIASYSISDIHNKYPIDYGLKIVTSSYGSALLLWVVVVMFITLNYS